MTNDIEHFSNPIWCYEFLLNELKDIAVFSIDLDLRITGWSPGVERLLGYAQADFIGQDAGFIFTPEDRAEGIDRKEFAKAVEIRRASDTRWHLKKDGGRIFVDGVLNAVRDKTGAHVGYVKIVRDVFPDRVWQRVTATILDDTPDAISVKDHRGRFAFVDPTMARTLGNPAANIIGHTIRDFQPAHLADAIRHDDEVCLKAGTPHMIEENVLSADHGLRTFLSAKAPLKDLEGGCVSNSADRTSGHCNVFVRNAFSRGSQRCYPSRYMLGN